MSRVLVMVGTRKGAFFYVSDPDRQSWRLEGPLFKGWEVGPLFYDRRGEGRLWAGVGSYVYGPHFQVSEDFGKTWKQIEGSPAYGENAGRKVKAIWTVAPGPPDQPDVLFAGVDEAGLFVSRDGGDSWQEVPGLNDHPTREEWQPGAGGLCCHSVIQDPEDPQRIWVGISAVGVFRSDDGGATFQTRNEGLPIAIEGKKHKDVGTCVHALLRTPDGRLFQQNHQGVFRSVDGADSWQRIEEGLPSIFGFPICRDPGSGDLFTLPLESDEYRFFIDGQVAVYRSRNGGDSWDKITAGLPESGFYSGVLRHSLAADGLPQGGLYFGTTGGQLFGSRDAGESWTRLPGDLPRVQSVSAVVLEGDEVDALEKALS